MKRKLQRPAPQRVISGGQVGADTAALRAARSRGIATGGAAPRSFKTAAGARPELAAYGLREVGGGRAADYPTRSMLNVDDADATLAIRWRESAGTDKTIAYALTHGWPNATPGWPVPPDLPAVHRPHSAYRPVLVVTELGCASVAAVRAWLEEVAPATLNVCGNRPPPGDRRYEARVEAFLTACLGGEPDVV